MKTSFIIVGIVVLSAAVILPVDAAPIHMADSLTIPTVIVINEETVTTSINITNTMNGPIQTILFDIEYDNAVVALTGVSSGSLTASGHWQHIVGENNKSITTATAYKDEAIPNGSSGSIILLHFTIVGTKGDSSTLTLTSLDMANTALQHGTAPLQSGEVIINSIPSAPHSPSPPNGATDVSVSTSLSWTCEDPDGNDLRYDVYFGTSASPPKRTSNQTGTTWNTGTLQYSTTYHWHVVAWDGHGAHNTSNLWQFTTKDAPPYPPENEFPTISLNSPADDATVSGTVTISGTASDSDGTVESVQVQIDAGSWQMATGTTSWTYSWDTTSVSDGSHTISAWVSDDDDCSTFVSITVTVNNTPSNQAPTVTIIAPTSGTQLKGRFTIRGTASDPDGNESLERVELKIGNASWMVVTGTTSWNYNWDSTAVENGNYTIQARSYDGTNYSEIDSISITVNNKKDDDGTPSFQFILLLAAAGIAMLVLRRNRRY
ncbi:MAG: Ig-like domain-containing protein [Candidatus Thermoplasmatota archaeon]|nr:Ig-like domain-containing protein [Candidatus Thermoplasmatota archaeon]